MNCPPKFLNLLKMLVDGDYSDPLEISTGMRQGCVLSPLLFLFNIQAVMKKMRESNQTGVTIKHQSDSNMFGTRGLKAQTKVKKSKISE